MTNKQPAKSKKKKRKLNWKNISIFSISILLIGTLGVAGILFNAARNLPDWDTAQLSGAKTTYLYDDQGQNYFNLHAEENRTEISIDQIPQDLIDAFIATEDKEFYQHKGINFRGIARAAVRNVQSGDLTGQGASTITQQLARNAFLSFDKKWDRKIQEVLLAFRLESSYSKDEILTMYLNKIYFGAGAYGVQAATNTYFGKDISELSLAESALLAGLVQTPSSYNPFQHYDRAKARQKVVLDNMYKSDFISLQERDDAYNVELIFKTITQETAQYGYFVDAVIEEAVDILSSSGKIDEPNNAIYRGGLQIYTTMNQNVQKHAEQLFSNAANFPNQSKGDDIIQGAVVLIDHRNGEIKTLVGGRKYENRRGFNRATSAYRQPGSAFKPIAVYAPALEQGYMPFYVLNDTLTSYKIGGSVWTPRNYDHQYRGLITMRTAVQWSVNTYAVQLLDQFGVKSGYDFAESLGIEVVSGSSKSDMALSPLALGSLTKGATPKQMAAAYGSFGNGGNYIKPHLITKIVDANGMEIYNHKNDYHRVMSPETAWLMSSMLQTAVSSGTGSNAGISGLMTAGKTGTSEHYRDSWFCGFSPAFSAAVWMGYDKNHTMSQVFGGGFPAKIWRSIIQEAHKNVSAAPQAQPANVIRISVDSRTGLLPSDFTPEGNIISEYCRKDSVPKESSDIYTEVYICPDSNLLATEFCPDPQSKFMEKEDADLPTEHCSLHGSFAFPDTDGIGNIPQSKIIISVCNHPSNDGRIFRANIPGYNHKGGCPNEYIENVEIKSTETFPYCSVPEHQVKRANENNARTP